MLSGKHNAPHVIGQAKVTPDNVLEQADSLGLNELGDHVAEDGADGIKALVSLTDVGQAHFVKENLLDDEDGDRFAELRAVLHDAETERDDFCGEEEGDDIRVVILLDESANDAEGGQAQILKGTSL